MVLLMIALTWLTGCLLLAVLPSSLPSRRADVLADLALAFGVGAVLQHSGFLLISWLGPVPLWSLGLVPVLLASFLLWQLRSARGIPLPVEPCPSLLPTNWAILGCLLSVQLFMLFPVLDLPLFDWEGRMLWALKAKLLAADFTVTAEPFRDPYRLHVHPRYPLMVPWLTALLGRAGSGFREIHYLAVILVFALLTTWQLYRSLARPAGKWAALAGGVILITTSAWYTAEINLQVEIVLAYFLLSSLCCLIEWLEAGQKRNLYLAGILLAGAAMTKNEGLLLTVCVIGAFVAAGWRRERTGRLLMAAGSLCVMTLLLVLPWFLQVQAIPAVSDENYLQRLSVGVFTGGVVRLPLIMHSFVLHMADWELWHVFWLVMPLLVMLTLFRWRRVSPALRLVAMVWSGYLLGITTIYIISPWADIALHIDNSFDRVMLPLLPCGVLLLGLLADRRSFRNPA